MYFAVLTIAFKRNKRRGVASRVRWASAQRCGGRGDTREETISRQSKRSADSREGREGPRDVGLRSGESTESCTEIVRGILKFCCQFDENFRSVHTYHKLLFTTSVVVLLLLFNTSTLFSS